MAAAVQQSGLGYVSQEIQDLINELAPPVVEEVKKVVPEVKTLDLSRVPDDGQAGGNSGVAQRGGDLGTVLGIVNLGGRPPLVVPNPQTVQTENLNIAAFDHMQERAWIISETPERADEMEELLRHRPKVTGSHAIEGWQSNFTREDYEKAIARVLTTPEIGVTEPALRSARLIRSASAGGSGPLTPCRPVAVTSSSSVSPALTF